MKKKKNRDDFNQRRDTLPGPGTNQILRHTPLPRTFPLFNFRVYFFLITFVPYLIRLCAENTPCLPSQGTGHYKSKSNKDSLINYAEQIQLLFVCFLIGIYIEKWLPRVYCHMHFGNHRFPIDDSTIWRILLFVYFLCLFFVPLKKIENNRFSLWHTPSPITIALIATIKTKDYV